MSVPMPSQEVLQSLLDYNPETGELRWRARGFPQFDNRLAGKPAFTARDGRGYPIGRIFDRSYRAHRVIWKLVHGQEPLVIDHIDRDTGNNRLSNLRNGTQRDNLANRRSYRRAVLGKRAGKLSAVSTRVARAAI